MSDGEHNGGAESSEGAVVSNASGGAASTTQTADPLGDRLHKTMDTLLGVVVGGLVIGFFALLWKNDAAHSDRNTALNAEIEALRSQITALQTEQLNAQKLLASVEKGYEARLTRIERESQVLANLNDKIGDELKEVIVSYRHVLKNMREASADVQRLLETAHKHLDKFGEETNDKLPDILNAPKNRGQVTIQVRKESNDVE